MTFGALDDDGLAERLLELGSERRTLFAASLAERLMPLFELYAEDGRSEADYGLFRILLDDVWQRPVGRGFGAQMQRLENAIPDDDDGTVLAPFAQNAAIAVVAAAESALGGASGAARAAIQLYEAADFAANLSNPSLDPNEPAYESQIAASPSVTDALKAIQDDLALLVATNDLDALRRRAESQGEEWAATWLRAQR